MSTFDAFDPYVPSRSDSRTASVKFSWRMPEEQFAAMEVIVESRDTPWRTKAEFIREATGRLLGVVAEECVDPLLRRRVAVANAQTDTKRLVGEQTARRSHIQLLERLLMSGTKQDRDEACMMAETVVELYSEDEELTEPLCRLIDMVKRQREP